ncbi:MAG TPA: 3-isopropylmalate dehydratase small subunit [Gammaproteobacteria bacterium]|nr:3-isopropylmalate dehydratase small subunit [Gammaproteobacteria bacterium]|tara:strand:- start:2249 stop:2890 length:642 start_codon:yes stop_codon:yes gene_type:complete
MEPVTKVHGIVLPIDRPNVDTDAIIPKQFLKSIKRSGFGVNLFDEWRYLDQGEADQDCSGRPINKDFVLNQPRYYGAEILLAGINFGCGSSREHAPWALHDYGIRALIAPSFADIFYSNACKNGLVPVTLAEDIVDKLFSECNAEEGYSLTVDLEAQIVITPAGGSFPFEFNQGLRNRLLNGLDDIGVSLKSAGSIRAYEARRAIEVPWFFQD